MPPDPSPIPPEALLRHAGFLRSLARSLALDPGLRDDAVQDTWVAAIKRPPTDESRIKGWLATVLRNAVRKRRRSERRRTRREQLHARPEATPSVADQATREEVLRDVVAALFGLRSEQREVVLLRFYEGLPPREIAVRTGVSVNTVKSRLRRGLHALRDDLEGAAGTRWQPALLSLAGIESRGFEALGAAVGAQAAASTGSVILMTTKLKLAVGALALAMLSIVGWQVLDPADEFGASSVEEDHALVALESGPRPGLEPQPLEPTSEYSAWTPSATVPGPTPGGAGTAPRTIPGSPKRFSEGPTQATRERLGLLEPAPPGVLEGAFFMGEDASSDAEAYVWDATRVTTAAAIPAGREPLAKVLVGSDGRFRFDHLEPGKYFVGIKSPGHAARLAYKTLELGEDPTDKAIIVFGTATLSGHVYDTSGSPAVDVTVRVSNTAAGAWKTIADTRTDSQGYYEFTGLLSGIGVMSVSLTNDLDDGANTRYRQFLASAGGRTVEDFGSPGGTPLLTGTVNARCGEPLRGPGRMILSEQGSTQFLDVTYGSDGRFSHRVPTGTYDVIVWLRGLYSHRTLKLVGALTVGDRDLTQDFEIPGTRLHGEVEGAGGSGERARVGCVRNKVWIWVPISRDGTYVFDGLEPGTYGVRAGENIEAMTIVEGQTDARVDLAFPPR